MNTYDGPEKVTKLSELDSDDELERLISKHRKKLWIEKGEIKGEVSQYNIHVISKNGKYFLYSTEDAIYLHDMGKGGSDVQVSSGRLMSCSAPSNQGTLIFSKVNSDTLGLAGLEAKIYMGGVTKKLGNYSPLAYEYTNSGDVLIILRDEEAFEMAGLLGKYDGLLVRYDGNEIDSIDTNVRDIIVGEDEGYIRFIADGSGRNL